MQRPALLLVAVRDPQAVQLGSVDAGEPVADGEGPGHSRRGSRIPVPAGRHPEQSARAHVATQAGVGVPHREQLSASGESVLLGGESSGALGAADGARPGTGQGGKHEGAGMVHGRERARCGAGRAARGAGCGQRSGGEEWSRRGAPRGVRETLRPVRGLNGYVELRSRRQRETSWGGGRGSRMVRGSGGPGRGGSAGSEPLQALPHLLPA